MIGDGYDMPLRLREREQIAAASREGDRGVVIVGLSP